MGFFHQVFYKVLKDIKKTKDFKFKEYIEVDAKKHKIKLKGRESQKKK